MITVKQIHRPADDTPAPPLNVAAYCRVSSDSEDQLHSYAAQIKYYTEYIGQQTNWVLADIYADEGLTGTKLDKRDEFKRMLTDARRGKIDRVLVKSITRFARNTVDALEATRLLKKYGVSVYFEEQDLDTAEMSDEFILTMHGMSAQGESQALSQNMRWSYKRRFESGTFIPCSTPYGYRLKDRDLVIHEEEAATVRQIFAWFLSGLGKQQIADRLGWHPNKIAYILRNTRYMGDALLQKRFRTEDLPFREIVNIGQMPQYYVENDNPPIISRETFAAAQELIGRKTVTNRKSKEAYPLSGKIRCSCGAAYRRIVINDTVYWGCRKHNLNKNYCGGSPLPEYVIYEAFILMTAKLRASREYLLAPLIRDLEALQNRNSGVQNKVYELDRQIAELGDRGHVIARLHTKGILDAADYTAQSGMISQKTTKLRIQRRTLLAEDENCEQLDDLRTLVEIIERLESPPTAFDENLFGEIVEGIRRESVGELIFRLLGGLELPEALSYRKRR
jgi:DNA invertase Pin-like site-specific DNA recombinase